MPLEDVASVKVRFVWGVERQKGFFLARFRDPCREMVIEEEVDYGSI